LTSVTCYHSCGLSFHFSLVQLMMMKKKMMKDTVINYLNLLT